MARDDLIWHEEAISPDVEELLRRLSREEALRSFYLAGGTALALHLGHRRSLDLDFFSAEWFDEDRILAHLQRLADLSVAAKDRGTLHVQISKVKVSLLAYPYPLLFPVLRFSGISVADPRDIACMKISAIASRGTRRDFVDLFVAAQRYGLPALIELFHRKYAAVSFNRLHVLKSLTYFHDAELEPMPQMLVPTTWQEVRRFFEKEVLRLDLDS